MSLVAMVWALKTAPISDPVAKLVLIGLADHAHDDGTASWPSQATLAEYAGVTDRTVRTKLGDLEDAGLIRRGDQQLVAHLGSHRPVVWDLAIPSTGKFFRPVPAVRPEASRPEIHDSPDRKSASDKPSLEPPYSSRGGNSPDAHPREEPPTPQPRPDHGPTATHRGDRCAVHQADAFPPPCRGCATAREESVQASADADRRMKELAVARRAQERQDRRDAVNACRYCDDDGYIHGHPCDHTDPEERARATAAVRAKVRAALSTPVPVR